ncbi:RNA-directed DNA polymerase, eukaryota, reverse transcriptase zinc-binding domain protein [Tanacetum coccineum]
MCLNKKDDMCLDQASREGLEEHVSHGDVGDKMMSYNGQTKGIVLDSEVVDVQNDDDSIGVVEKDGKVNFGSVSDDMIRMYDGTSNDNEGKEESMQGVKETEQGNKQGMNTVQGVNNVQMKGISALASRLGKPLVMDSVTANKCKQGIGMVRYDRVIIEVSAKKTLANDVEIVYKNTEGMVQSRKNVKVKYDWKPPMCSECGVFEHTSSRCYKNAANIHTNTKALQENVKGKVNAINNDQIKPNVQKEKNGGQTEDSDEGFVEVKRKKNVGIDNKVKRHNFRANPQVSKVGNNSKTVYQAKNKEAKSPIKNPNITPEKEAGKMKKGRLEVGEITTKNDMLTYYKQKSEELVDKGKKANTKVENNVETEDVLHEIGCIAKCMEENEVKGLSTSEKHDEIVKLIQEEKLQICVVLKTHLKSKKIGKVCDIIFGRWKWFTNMSYCNKGCRIMVGWNDDVINIGVVYMARQSVLVKVETRDGKLRLYCTLIYASNSGLERKDLWRDLEIYKRIVGQEPWFLSGDLNVTLTPKEHSIGSSAMSSDMKDFQRCVNIIEVEDINSSVLFYTWTKNLHKTKNGGQTRILKKLDIVMGNKDFSNGFCQSYAMFLPYIISDHCPSILVIPNGVQRKKKPFKFAKFITDKEEFKALVSQYGGGMDDGYRMFKSIKNLNGLKKHLKQLAWCNGDVFENVKKLREAVKDCKLSSVEAEYMDNIMIAQELFKGYDRKSGPKKVVVKVDIQKAYDTLNWQFWKGDPISPYLFTLVMEILSLIIKRKVDQSRDFQYHFGYKKLKVTNVCFTDDLLMFCHDDKSSVKVLKEFIDEFGKVAALIPNYNKSTIIFGSLDDDEKKDMLEVMPFKVENLLIRYLGVPLTSKRLRAKECKSLIDKVESKVSSWKNKCLSYAGRLMLVASVLETIHVYWAFVFLLPIGIIEDINKLLKNFLWQQTDGTKGRAKLA